MSALTPEQRSDFIHHIELCESYGHLTTIVNVTAVRALADEADRLRAASQLAVDKIEALETCVGWNEPDASGVAPNTWSAPYVMPALDALRAALAGEGRP